MNAAYGSIDKELDGSLSSLSSDISENNKPKGSFHSKSTVFVSVSLLLSVSCAIFFIASSIRSNDGLPGKVLYQITNLEKTVTVSSTIQYTLTRDGYDPLSYFSNVQVSNRMQTVTLAPPFSLKNHP